MTRKEPRTSGWLRRVTGAVTYIKLSVWAVFLLVMPAMCLQRGTVGAAILLGVLGLLLDVTAVELLFAWARSFAPTIRRWMTLYHLGVVLAGGYLLLQPIDPRWTRLPELDGLENMAVAGAPEGLLVLGSGELQLVARGQAPRSLEYPGPFAWVSHGPADGTVWVVPRDAPQIFRRVDERWDSLPRPAGNVSALAGGPARLWLVVERGLFTLRPEDVRWDRSNDCPGATGVAVAPDDEDQVLVVGRRWCASVDGGREWIEMTPPPEQYERFPEAALGGGGWQYVYSSAMWRSTLHVRGPGESGFTERASPASDVRVLVADPRDGRRVWAGTWGEGVFLSADGGASWSDFGLQRIQTRTMAIDPVARTLAVASSNLIFDRGVYLRPIDE
jgi:hypothetical protein